MASGGRKCYGPASVRINMASGLVVNRRRSFLTISRSNSIPLLVSVEDSVLLFVSVGGIVSYISGRNCAPRAG